jgi:hypothetical protein
MAWHVCNYGDCRHHNFHYADWRCAGFNQVKYCGKVRGFVTDIPADEMDKELASDPNLAFKFRKDVEKGNNNE